MTLTIPFQRDSGGGGGFTLSGQGVTVGLTPTDIITFTPTLPGVYTFIFTVSAYNTTGDLGAGVSLMAAVHFDGSVSTLCNTPVDNEVPEGSMSNIDVTMTVSGPNASLTVTGYQVTAVDQIINWAAIGYFSFVGE